MPPTLHSQDKPPISPQLSSEHESPSCMLRMEGTSSLASQSSQVHLPEAAAETVTSSGDGPTTVGAVSVVGCRHSTRKLNATLLSGVKKVLGLNNGQLYSEGGIRAVHREQLIFDMNDFDEEEVYIRRNRWDGKLKLKLYNAQCFTVTWRGLCDKVHSCSLTGLADLWLDRMDAQGLRDLLNHMEKLLRECL